MVRPALAAAFALTLLLAGPAGAQVEAFDWTFEYTPFDGSIDQQGDLFHVNGPNGHDMAPQIPDHIAWVSAVAPVDAHVTVSAAFENFDSGGDIWDAPVYLIDGALHFPPTGGVYHDGDYDFAFDVEAGQVFGFGVWSADSDYGPGIADFTDFVFDPVTWHDAGHGLDPREWLTVPPPAGLTDFGSTIGSLGDLNGDSRADFAVGAPDSGRVIAISGADGSTLLDIAGLADPYQTVRGAGDVDGDGLPDIVIGLPYHDTAHTDAGRIEVRSGADGSLLFAVDGESAGSRLGVSVSGARDVNGDGFADVVAGAPAGLPGSEPGYVLLLAGPSGAVLNRFEAPGWGFGWAVSGLGDADGDGLSDIVIASLFSGQATVFSGATYDAISTADHEWYGVGADLAPIGDADGDGLADYVWGQSHTIVTHYGSVMVVAGDTGSILHRIDGDNPFDSIGQAVAGGDFDGDGVPDVAYVSRHLDDEVGRVRVLSGASDWSSTIHELRAGPEDYFGVALAAASGLDADGANDLAVGAPHNGLGLRLIHALDGNGQPRLAGTGDLGPGSPFSISLTDARGHAPVVLVVSLTRVDLPAKGGVLVPFPTSLFPLFTNGAGTFTAGSTWPASIPGGITLWMQAWIGDGDGPYGFTASNGLGGETP